MPVTHASPHWPQLLLSVCLLTQLVPQRVVPLLQTQLPQPQAFVHVLVPVPPHTCVEAGAHTPWLPQLDQAEKLPSLLQVRVAVPQLPHAWVRGPLHAHIPAWQVTPGAHANPHEPQFLASLVTSRQLPPQAAKPLAQMNPQLPAVQVAVPWAGTGQANPHEPQLLGSLLVSTHAEPQVVPAQVFWHWGEAELPAEVSHTVPAAQAVVHDPQWRLSLSAVSQPLLASPSQSPYPAAHAAAENAHSPALHVVFPLTWARAVQSLSHAPHVRRSLADTHFPAPPQAICPLAHSHAPH